MRFGFWGCISPQLFWISLAFATVIDVDLSSPGGIAGAISAATSGDTVRIHAGLYTGNSSCDLQITISNIAMIGISGANSTIIDCQHLSRCISVTGTNVAISGITFKNGRAPNLSATGVRDDADHQIIRDIQRSRLLPRRSYLNVPLFSIQVFLTPKGRLMKKQVGKTLNSKRREKNLTKTKAQIRANSPQSLGGCIAVLNGSSLVLSQVVVTGGQALKGCGIGVIGAAIRIVDSAFMYNGMDAAAGATIQGGGGYFYQSAVNISKSTFSNNYISAATEQENIAGGGLYIANCSNTALYGPIILEYNAAIQNGFGGVNGGAMCIDSCVNLTHVGLLSISHNVAMAGLADYTCGGGMYAVRCTNLKWNGTISVVNNTIQSSYYVESYGGGIYLYLCTNTSWIGSMNVSKNVMSQVDSDGICAIYGGGISLYDCVNTNFSADIFMGSNMLLSSATDADEISGGALYAYASSIVSFSGKLTVVNNSLVRTNAMAKGVLEGGGLAFHECAQINFEGPVSVVGNSLVSNGVGSLYGGGLWIKSCDQIFISGNFSIAHNNVVSLANFNLATPSTSYFVAANPSGECNAQTVTITESAGFLDDGSFNKEYSSNLHCSWLLRPEDDSFSKFSKVYNISFQKLDTKMDYAYVYIYDGISSAAPLIGQYSGNLVNGYSCSDGMCPSLFSPIISSTASVFLAFTTSSKDNNAKFEGFALNWTTIKSNVKRGMTGLLLTNSDDYPTMAAGGGMYAVTSILQLSGIDIAFNTISSVIGFSAGAGIYLDSCIDGLTLESSAIHDNAVSGFHSGGAGITAAKYSNLKVSGTLISANNASTSQYNKCINIPSKGMICPSVFGGNVLASSRSQVVLQSCNINNGYGLCCSDCSLPCSAVGGSVAAFHPGTILAIRKSNCSNSVAASICTDNTWNTGGCLFVQDAAVALSDFSIVRNAVLGRGYGGGVSCSGSSSLDLRRSILSQNNANQGGAIAIAVKSTVNISNCDISRNTGTLVGGALFVNGESSKLDMVDSTFNKNYAPTASAIYSFDDGADAFYNISNSNYLVPPGSISVMLGRLNVTKAVFNCTLPGSVFLQQNFSKFFQLACVGCEEGTYAIESASTLTVDRKCQICPYGGRCLGSNEKSNGLYALPDYWGKSDENGTVKFYLCPSSYCCKFGQDCSFNQCNANRNDTLCGRCIENFGMRFFVEGCRSNDSCNDSVWFGWIIVALAFLAVIVLLVTAEAQTTGIMSVMLYFYQVLPFVKSTSWKNTSSILLLVLQSIFNLAPFGNSEIINGVCLMPSMTTSQKLGSRLLLQAVVFVTMFAVFIGHSVLTRLRVCKWAVEHPPCVAHYVAAGIRFCTIAFTTLVLVPLQMIQCVPIDGKSVWWWDAGIECFELWQKAGFVSISVLGPLPFIVILIFWKKWKNENSLSSNWQKEIYKILSGGFREERRWWLGVSLYRRLLMVVVYSTIVDSNWKSMATSLLCVIFLVINFVLKPFKLKTSQQCESASLVLLCILSLSTSPGLAEIQFASLHSVHGAVQLEWLQLALAAAPAIVYAAHLCRSLQIRIKNKLAAKKIDAHGNQSGNNNNNNNMVIVVNDFGFWEQQYC